MNNDTAFAQGLDGEVDPLYAGHDDTPPADRQQREDALPRGIYVVEFQAGKGGFTKDPDPRLGKVAPRLRVGAKVLAGVEGTIGRVAFGGLSIYPSGNVYEKVTDGSGETKRVPRPATNEEYDKAIAAHLGVLKRIQQVLGLVYGLPAKPITQETLDEFGKQFAGKRAVLDLSYMAGNEEFDASNLFIWASIAALDEPVKDKSGKELGTAYEVAIQKIDKANKRAAAKASAGRTASQFSGASPSGF